MEITVWVVVDSIPLGILASVMSLQLELSEPRST